MSRIKITDTVSDVVIKMSEGNPGAIKVALALIQEDIHLLLMCDAIGLYGSKLYMLCNDCCDGDIQKTKNVILAWQRGEISAEEIRVHLSGGYGRPFDTINKPEGDKEGGAQDDASETLADVLAEMERLGEKWTDDPSPNKTECLGLIVLRYRNRIMSAIARQPSAGHVVEMGNLAESLSRHIADSLPYVEREVVAGVIAEKVPEVGIMVQSSREEIQSIAGDILYKDVIITPKETKEETK